MAIWPFKIEHQSLCSATGIPHSMQTWTRCFGASLMPNRLLSNDIPGSRGVAISLSYVGRLIWVPGCRDVGQASNYASCGVEPDSFARPKAFGGISDVRQRRQAEFPRNRRGVRQHAADLDNHARGERKERRPRWV